MRLAQAAHISGITVHRCWGQPSASAPQFLSGFENPLEVLHVVPKFGKHPHVPPQSSFVQAKQFFPEAAAGCGVPVSSKANRSEPRSRIRVGFMGGTLDVKVIMLLVQATFEAVRESCIPWTPSRNIGVGDSSVKPAKESPYYFADSLTRTPGSVPAGPRYPPPRPRADHGRQAMRDTR